MADEDIEDKEEGVDELKTKLAKDQAKDLDKVTDFVEEKELDSRKAQQKVQNILAADQKDDKKLAREKELASVAIKPEDVDLIVQELEIGKDKAELTLREHKGDVVAALRHLIST